MSTCAVLLVKDEVDVIEYTLQHLAYHVDEILVADNGSTDGTRELLAEIEVGIPLGVADDLEPGHYQGRKTTALAMEALELGHRWLLPVDADEIWYAPEGRRIADWLDGLGREHQFVKATIFNHVATANDPLASCSDCGGSGIDPHSDPDEPENSACVFCDGVGAEPNPFRRLRWKQREPLDIRWGKVACRLRPDLEIGEGNHSARTHGVGTTGYGLELRHFPYRSAEHFVAKAVKGLAALEATDLDEGTGAHWRAYGKAVVEGGPQAGEAWFYDAFYSEDPERDDTLIYDPAPVKP